MSATSIQSFEEQPFQSTALDATNGKQGDNINIKKPTKIKTSNLMQTTVSKPDPVRATHNFEFQQWFSNCSRTRAPTHAVMKLHGSCQLRSCLFLYSIFQDHVRIEYTEFSHPFMLPLRYILSYFCFNENYFFIMFLRFNDPFVHTIPLARIFGGLKCAAHAMWRAAAPCNCRTPGMPWRSLVFVFNC